MIQSSCRDDVVVRFQAFMTAINILNSATGLLLAPIKRLQDGQSCIYALRSLSKLLLSSLYCLG